MWLSLQRVSFYLCNNQTRHASDSSALCRVISASRKVCGYPCGWLPYLFKVHQLGSVLHHLRYLESF